MPVRTKPTTPIITHTPAAAPLAMDESGSPKQTEHANALFVTSKNIDAAKTAQESRFTDS
jgi:hypothetical protein